MSKFNNNNQRNAIITVSVMIIVIFFILSTKRARNEYLIKASPQVTGEVFGSMPKPTEPGLLEPAMKPFQKQTRKIVIKRIPRLKKGKPMPHKNWGTCDKCHLLAGGPAAGSQPKTPVGSVLEKLSAIKKVGPPILPDSNRPHPAAGRCIKCHDIVLKIPV